MITSMLRRLTLAPEQRTREQTALALIAVLLIAVATELLDQFA